MNTQNNNNLKGPVVSSSMTEAPDQSFESSGKTNPKRIAIVQPIMVPGGGTESVTAWTAEALKRQAQVTLISFSHTDVTTLNRFYGTNLADNEISIIRPGMVPGLNKTKRLSLLKDHLMMRYCKSVAQKYDLFISSCAMDFGRPGIQFIQMGPDSNSIQVLQGIASIPRWYLLLKRLVVRVCKLISGYSEEATKRNVHLPNSKATGLLLENVFNNNNYKVIYPPVTSPPTVTPWRERKEGFLSISRIEPYKGLDRIIQILKQVRQRGFDVELKIIGRVDDKKYFGSISRLVAENASWISLASNISRNEMFKLMNTYKYGINGALDEHFGIAVAEMTKSGSIVFVPHRGGQTEIIDTPQLIYSDIDNAVEKITQVLGNKVLQEKLLRHLKSQGDIFSSQSFCLNIQETVDDFFSGQPYDATGGS